MDLFGVPVLPPLDRRGRPAHKPTEQLRQLARKMHRDGASQPEIAKAIGITVPTLHRHYHTELQSRSQAWRGLKGEVK